MEKFKYSKDNPRYKTRLNHEQIERSAASCRKILEHRSGPNDVVDLSENFDMITVMLLTGYSLNEIRAKLMKAYTDENLKAQITASIDAHTLPERFAYPGGYDQFVKDVHNKIYGDIDLLEEK
jgi:hypothetical protein